MLETCSFYFKKYYNYTNFFNVWLKCQKVRWFECKNKIKYKIKFAGWKDPLMRCIKIYFHFGTISLHSRVCICCVLSTSKPRCLSFFVVFFFPFPSSSSSFSSLRASGASAGAARFLSLGNHYNFCKRCANLNHLTRATLFLKFALKVSV